MQFARTQPFRLLRTLMSLPSDSATISSSAGPTRFPVGSHRTTMSGRLCDSSQQQDATGGPPTAADRTRVAAATDYATHAAFQLRQGLELMNLVRTVNVPGGVRKVVDVGCGTGELTRAWQARVPWGHVLGLDPDASRIEYAQSQAKTTGPNKSVSATTSESTEPVEPVFVVGDSDTMLQVVPSDWIGAVDVVFCNHVCHWIKSKEAFFRVAMTLLRPGGRLVVQSPETDVKLLTKLLKLMPTPPGALSLDRAIQIRGLAKTRELAHKVGFVTAEHADIQRYTETFDTTTELFKWMHGMWQFL